MLNDKLPDFGRVTKFTALMMAGMKCRWCGRPLVKDERGLVVCPFCDVPGVPLDKLQAPSA